MTDTINYHELQKNLPREVRERMDIGLICGCGNCYCCATLAGKEAEFLQKLQEQQHEPK